MVERSYNLWNMRSTEDLSTPARIRDAAIREFAAQGFSVGVRAIASRAGVAPGLVNHHFGGKAGLQDRCDEQVVRHLLELKAAGELDVQSIAAHFAPAEDGPLPYAAYARRMLEHGSARADALFDALVDGTRRTLADQQRAGAMRADLDVDALAPVLTVYGLAPVMMPGLLARAVGASSLDADALAQAAQTLAPVLQGGLVAGR